MGFMFIILLMTLLLTLGNFKKLQGWNHKLSLIIKKVALIAAPLILLYVVVKLATNWDEYEKQDIAERVIVVIVAATLGILLDKLLRKIEANDKTNPNRLPEREDDVIMSNKLRIDRACKVVKVSPQTVYEAFMNPDAYVSWLPPSDMTGHLYEFDTREGGTFRMALTYKSKEYATLGKTSEDTDIAQGIFRELVPYERIVQVVSFESDDPQFAGDMSITWKFTPAHQGTNVIVECENVPDGIRQEDHIEGLNSTLENLAAFCEKESPV